MSGFSRRQGPMAWLWSLAAAVLGLLLGLGLLLWLEPSQALSGFRALLWSGVSSPEGWGETLRAFSPLLLCGLSVGLSGQAGLYNLGAPGQMALGALLALAAAALPRWPWWACLLVSMLGGALWGVIPGWLKAYRGVHEAVSTALLNWIGLDLVNLLLVCVPGLLVPAGGAVVGDRTADLSALNPGAIVPGLGALPGGVSLLIAVLMAAVLWVILKRTVFGYETRLCGHSLEAARYGGANVERSVTLALALSGALAGLGGAMLYLAAGAPYALSEELDPLGFAAIPAALLGAGHPLGIVVSALFVAALLAGQSALPPAFPREAVYAVLAGMTLLCALQGPALRLAGRRNGREEKRA